MTGSQAALKPGLRVAIRVEVARSTDTGAHWWRIVSTSNGQIIATSETYSSSSNAMRAARRFVAANLAEGVEIRKVVIP